MEALFSSVVGGDGLRQRVLASLREAVAAGGSRRVDVHIMTFSFTDRSIADLLAAVATSHPNVTVRIIADWNQGSAADGRQVARLEQLGLANLVVRYKHDQPYDWDPVADRLRWSYRTSRGLLHHKTLGVLIDGAPWSMLCGSFNWTETAANSYENLLLLTADDTGSREVMRSIEWEFEAMWTDGHLTLSPDEARSHYARILDAFRSAPDIVPAAVVGLGAGEGATLPTAIDMDDDETGSSASRPSIQEGSGAPVLIAFSSRAPHDTEGGRGFSPHNRARRFELHKPGGSAKHVPLTLTTLTLDVIARAQPGDTLKVAMYGLSPRVPEYGALLDAARRGVRLQVLLDGHVGASVLRQLALVGRRAHLPIELRAGNRMMHQKYIVHPETATVLTGTANLSTDASDRHCEHIIVIRHRPALAASFLADFALIWSRLAAPFPDPPMDRADHH